MTQRATLTTPFRDPLLPVFILPLLAVAVRVGLVASYGDLAAYYGSSLGATTFVALLASLLLLSSRRLER